MKPNSNQSPNFVARSPILLHALLRTSYFVLKDVVSTLGDSTALGQERTGEGEAVDVGGAAGRGDGEQRAAG